MKVSKLSKNLALALLAFLCAHAFGAGTGGGWDLEGGAPSEEKVALRLVTQAVQNNYQNEKCDVDSLSKTIEGIVEAAPDTVTLADPNEKTESLSAGEKNCLVSSFDALKKTATKEIAAEYDNIESHF